MCCFAPRATATIISGTGMSPRSPRQLIIYPLAAQLLLCPARDNNSSEPPSAGDTPRARGPAAPLGSIESPWSAEQGGRAAGPEMELSASAPSIQIASPLQLESLQGERRQLSRRIQVLRGRWDPAAGDNACAAHTLKLPSGRCIVPAARHVASTSDGSHTGCPKCHATGSFAPILKKIGTKLRVA